MGLHFIPQPGAAIWPPPSRAAPPPRPRGWSSGSSNGRSTIKGRKPYLSARHGRSEWRATAFPRHSPGLFPRGDRRSEKRAAGRDDIGGLQFSSQLAACAVPGRHSCDAAAVRSFTLSMHSFTLSCCGQRLSPWTMPHDPEIFRNEWLQKTTAPRCRTDSIGEDTESGIDESLRKLAKRKAPWTHTTPTS